MTARIGSVPKAQDGQSYGVVIYDAHDRRSEQNAGAYSTLRVLFFLFFFVGTKAIANKAQRQARLVKAR